MGNDLTPLEKDMLKVINFKHNTKYNHNHLMEWNTSKEVIEDNLKDDEEIFEARGMYLAIKTK